MDRTTKFVLLAAFAAMFMGVILLLVGLFSAWDIIFYYFWDWLLSPDSQVRSAD